MENPLISLWNEGSYLWHVYVAKWYLALCFYTKTMVLSHALGMVALLLLVAALTLGRFRWFPIRIIFNGRQAPAAQPCAAAARTSDPAPASSPS